MSLFQMILSRIPFSETLVNGSFDIFDLRGLTLLSVNVVLSYNKYKIKSSIFSMIHNGSNFDLRDRVRKFGLEMFFS